MIAALVGAALGCATPHAWTADNALAPTFAAIDTNQDGSLDASEWAATDPGAPPLAALDGDRDGGISLAELYAWMQQADPLHFDSAIARRPPDVHQLKAYFPEGTGERQLGDLLRYLSLELAARDPSATVPDAQLIAIAAGTGSLGHPATQHTLRQLQAGYAAAGLVFPPGLIAQGPPP